MKANILKTRNIMIFLLNFVHFEAVFAYSETDLLILKQKSPTDLVEDSFV